MVYSPLQAVELARTRPDRQVVFFAIGFETTAPANAMSVLRAAELGLTNFSVLVSHVLVPPAIRAILDSPENEVQAFLAAGHVCAVMGWREYEPIAAQYGVPIVVTGFEPLDLLEGIRLAVEQLEQGRAEVENAYARVVGRDGNPAARAAIGAGARVTDRAWRGIGTIPDSGLGLRPEYAEFDAEAPLLRRGGHSQGTPSLYRRRDPARRQRFPPTARPTPRSAPRGGHSVRRWSPRRGPAPRSSAQGAGATTR